MQVESSQLKWDPTGHPLWFNGLEQDLYLVIGEDEVRHFEISYGDKIVSGGASKALQFGDIQGNHQGIGQTLSRTVSYQKEIPDDALKISIEIVQSCENLEGQIKEGLISYLSGFGFGGNPLRFSLPLKSYVPLEKREYVIKKNKWRQFKKALPKHLGLKIIIPITIFGIFLAVITTIKSNHLQFLDRADRMNMKYLRNYDRQGGDLYVVDKNEMGILHHLSLSMSNMTSDKFMAFKYLIEVKQMDINVYDINGRTPLYYLVVRYINPESETSKKPSLRLIDAFIRLGANPKARRGSSSASPWEIAQQDPDLRKLFQQ